MLMLKAILAQICVGDWIISVDLKDAYLYIQVIQRHRRLIRFTFGAKAYQYRVLPFGLALALWVFTKYMDAALAPFCVVSCLGVWKCPHSNRPVCKTLGRVYAVNLTFSHTFESPSTTAFFFQVQVQVELYCHSAACGDIQWNEMSCLTGPRCYINTDIQHYKPIHKLTYWQVWLGILYINVYPIQLKIKIENTNYTICLPYTTKDKDKKYKLCECFT